jgi:hypothetical protein
LSKGDYIQWLDADDLLGPDKIRLQMGALGNKAGKRTLLSGAWGRFIYRPGRAVFSPSPLWEDLLPAEWLVRKIGQNLHMQTATWLVSRELTEAAGPWNTRLLGDDDGEYFCRVILASEGIRFVPNARVYYRVSGPASLSYVGQSQRKLEAHFLSMRLHVGYLRSVEDSPRAREACRKYLQGPMIWFYPERLDIFAKAQEMARELGFELETPRLSWKYAWIQAVFGWPTAKRVQTAYNRWKVRAIRSTDRLVSFFEPAQVRGIEAIGHGSASLNVAKP